MVSYDDRYIIFHCFRIENFFLNIKIKHFYVKVMGKQKAAYENSEQGIMPLLFGLIFDVLGKPDVAFSLFEPKSLDEADTWRIVAF
jgi:hypothetical protein